VQEVIPVRAQCLMHVNCLELQAVHLALHRLTVIKQCILQQDQTRSER